MSAVQGALREPWVMLDEQSRAARFGMWVFLASEVLFFSAFFLAFTYLRIINTAAFQAASAETNLICGTANAAILLTSSFTMGLVTRGARLGLRRISLGALASTACLGLLFIAVKGYEYVDDISKNLVPGPNFALHTQTAELFYSAYWIVTLIHAVHLSIGIGIMVRLFLLIWRRKLSLDSPQIEVAALYWTFVDIVWVLLYPVLYLGGRT